MNGVPQQLVDLEGDFDHQCPNEKGPGTVGREGWKLEFPSDEKQEAQESFCCEQ
jgi:hypothetical protein